ncbi:MAG: DegV family protein [Anaerolineae bacterium]|nr:DegV family protein [Anaerolineae bacterium]
MTHRIALISDSICDIPKQLIEQYQIHIVPLYLIWGKENLRDEIDIDAETFYNRLPVDPIHPTTSQPTPRDFIEILEQVKQAGAEEAVIITISNQLSGTYDSATQAKQAVDIPVHIHDSLSASMGQGWQVLAAARTREAGGSALEMVQAADAIRRKCSLVFTVDTLEYLHKGGRIGGAAKLLGTALNFKPQLYVDHETGRIEASKKVRTRKKALEEVFQTFVSEVKAGSGHLRLTVQHGNVEEEAKALAQRINDAFAPVELHIGSLTPVLGVHVGPGTIGIAGYIED